MSTPFRLHLPRAIHDDLLNQARTELPHECCGLLAGRLAEEQGQPVGRVERCYPLINVADEPARRYEAEVKGLFQADRDMRQRGLDLLAIYHSHPTSDPIPSRTDLERNWWPGVMSLIISLKSDEPQVRGWWLGEQDFVEAEWKLIADQT